MKQTTKATIYWVAGFGVESEVQEAMVNKSQSQRYYTLLEDNWLGPSGHTIDTNGAAISEDRSKMVLKAKRCIVESINNSLDNIRRGRESIRRLQ